MQQIWTEPLLLLLPLSQVVFSLVCSLSHTLTNGSHHQQEVGWLGFSPCSLHQETLTTVGCRTNQRFICVGLVWGDVGLPTHLHVEGLSPTNSHSRHHGGSHCLPAAMPASRRHTSSFFLVTTLVNISAPLSSV